MKRWDEVSSLENTAELDKFQECRRYLLVTHIMALIGIIKCF